LIKKNYNSLSSWKFSIYWLKKFVQFSYSKCNFKFCLKNVQIVSPKINLIFTSMQNIFRKDKFNLLYWLKIFIIKKEKHFRNKNVATNLKKKKNIVGNNTQKVTSSIAEIFFQLFFVQKLYNKFCMYICRILKCKYKKYSFRIFLS
jgi:hypothetical protein